jgi:hypothetical protein
MSNIDDIVREIESLYDDDEGSVREELYELLIPLQRTSYDDYIYTHIEDIQEFFNEDEF